LNKSGGKISVSEGASSAVKIPAKGMKTKNRVKMTVLDILILTSAPPFQPVKPILRFKYIRRIDIRSTITAYT
jgi:hypothetical protein